MGEPVLEVTHLVKQYGAFTALDGVSFRADRGELFGLLGPNGAGKTTLLSIVSSLIDATSGEVRVLGQKVSYRDRSLRRLVGIVPQESAIYGELTARENLEFFGEIYGVTGDELRSRVDAVLAAVGLSDRAGSRVDSFSGGMKRRLNLAAALVHRPKLLLLDEPTTGVDPQSRNHIFEEVRRLAEQGTCIIYTSHYIEEVQTLCSRIGIIDHGRLVACGSLEELLTRLAGLIRFRAGQSTPALRQRLTQLPGVSVNGHEGAYVELACQDVKGSLVRLVALLNELQIELVSLETTEPSLERVFLHLTGHALRD